MNLHDSPYMYMAGQQVRWLPMDSEERYKDNLKNQKHLLEQYAWLDSDFTYNFNTQGFRCREFTKEPNAVFLGSSLTLGIGIPEEHAWPTIVSKHLKLRCNNLAIGGSSNDTTFRIAEYWLEQLNPSIAFWYTAPRHRFDIWYNLNVHTVSPTWDTDIPLNDYLKVYVSNNHNMETNYRKNLIAVKGICYDLGIKLVLLEEVKHLFKHIDLARDLHHPGIKSNLAFADYVSQQV